MILHWFRRDLRLHDNRALDAARTEAQGAVLPLYIQSHWHGKHPWTGAPRMAFLCDALQSLDTSLREEGSRLVIRKGDPLEIFETLASECPITAIYYNRDPDPFGRSVEARLEKLGERLGIAVRGFDDLTLHPIDSLLNGSGHPYRVFTPYAKSWTKLPPPAASHPNKTAWVPLKSTIHSLPLPTLKSWGLHPTADVLKAGEEAASKRLDQFLSYRIENYKEARDFPSEEGTSRLSADLRWGTLSIRTLVAKVHQAAKEAPNAEARRSAFTFLNELAWREFYMAILWHWPEVLEQEFQPAFRKIPWLYPNEKPPFKTSIDPTEAFDRWKSGQTGFPIVDAAMRQLLATGFMHNRARMITAMFLTKDLHLDWRLGEAFFMQHLTDGEIASNNGGWQWSAGTGADAAPYFRIQNPWTQTQRYDAEGDYIRRWIPELAHLPGKAFTKPPTAPLAKGYPLPIVDHGHERTITLDLFARFKTP